MKIRKTTKRSFQNVKQIKSESSNGVFHTTLSLYSRGRPRWLLCVTTCRNRPTHCAAACVLFICIFVSSFSISGSKLCELPAAFHGKGFQSSRIWGRGGVSNFLFQPPPPLPVEWGSHRRVRDFRGNEATLKFWKCSNVWHTQQKEKTVTAVSYYLTEFLMSWFTRFHRAIAIGFGADVSPPPFFLAYIRQPAPSCRWDWAGFFHA